LVVKNKVSGEKINIPLFGQLGKEENQFYSLECCCIYADVCYSAM